MKDVIYSVYGREIARALLEVSQENSFMKIEGFVGKPEIARGNRSFENYYINGRYVKKKSPDGTVQAAPSAYEYNSPQSYPTSGTCFSPVCYKKGSEQEM